ncbi:MAG TPA: LLM class flavin-dependent oxidoreductase [Thermomicrobiales bacterium]|nr:LLM class flavin-dependent oxidoreductase [Thermomicrobiales bacterium]
MISHDLMAVNHWVADSRPMGIGLMMPISEGAAFGDTPHFSDIIEMAEVARDVGVDTLWFADHFTFGTPEEGQRGVWEAFTLMAGVAARVPDLNIGSLVSCTGFRNPGVIAKMTETIDDISNGRFILGLGAGWHKPEYDQFGMPFDHRVTRFEEAIEIIHPLLRRGKASSEGRFYSAQGAVNQPRGPRPQGAPILVGSTGDRMLGITVKYADAWNTVWHKEAEEVRPLMDKVDQACRHAGRDPQTLVRAVGGNVAMEGYLGRRPNPIEGDDEAKAEAIAGFREVGMRHFVAGLDPSTPQSIEQFGRVIEILDRS